MPPPRVCPGHEIAGEVAAVGAAVTTLRAGDRVALEGIASCGACRWCRAGTYNYLRVQGSMVYNRVGARADFEIVQDLLARAGGLIGKTLVTHRFALDDVAAAFRTAADKTSGSIKVTIAEEAR